MLRCVVVGCVMVVLAVLPANVSAAGAWTERVVGDAAPGLPLGESFSVTPDGVGVFAVATTSPLSTGTLMASTVVGGVPGPLAPVGGAPMGAIMTLLAAGPGQTALVAVQLQDGAQRVTLARGAVGGLLGPGRVLVDVPASARIGRALTSVRGDVAITYATDSGLRVVVARPSGRVRDVMLARGPFMERAAAAFSPTGDLVVVAARARANGLEFLARRLTAGGQLGPLERLDRIRADDGVPAMDVAVAGQWTAAAWRVAGCGEEGCGPATAKAVVLGARRPSTLSRRFVGPGPDSGTPRVTVAPNGRATVVWTDRSGKLRAADLRRSGRGRSTVISDPGAPAQPLALQRTPTGEIIVLSVRGACPCPSPWTLQATLRSPGGRFRAPEQVAAEGLPNPYAWLAIDPSRRLALTAYDFAGQRLTVAAHPY